MSELPAALSEAQFQQAVVNLAKVCGWRVMHTRRAYNRSGRVSTPLQGHAGYPDLTLAKGGRVLWFELKSARGSVEVAQREWLAELPAEQAFVFRPRDWPRIEELLGEGRIQ